MRQNSAARVTTPAGRVIPFENGDHMDRTTFHELYRQTPEGLRAELIGGVVYLASPTSSRHGRPHARAIMWLGGYADATPGTDVLDNTTTILNDESELQPDATLYILPEYGGRVTETDEGYLRGGPELVVEVALSSAAIDLHKKRLEYEQAGVREYVVALVEQKEVRWFARGRSGLSAMKPRDGVFQSRVFPGLWLDPAALFDRAPRKLLDPLRAGLATPAHAAFVAKLAKRAKKAPPPAAGE